ncbi:MAG: lipase maturation factor family protein [Opitutus sp.]
MRALSCFHESHIFTSRTLAAIQNRWVLSVCDHLLRGTPEVLRLFSRNPFPERPPLLIRVVRYDYHFTTADQRRRTGNIWRRTPLDFYVEPASLR